MDEREVFEVIDEATFNMDNSTCDELVGLLNYMEYVVKKTELFKKRINYIYMSCKLLQSSNGEGLQI